MFQPEDEISRCLIYSRFFPGNIHSDADLFQFGEAKADGAAHESGVARSLAPDAADVHRIGCKIAAGQNETKGQPEPGPKRKYYCGFRTARYGELTLANEGYRLEILIKEEAGEPAHTDIALFLLVEGRSARSTYRAAAGLALAEAFGAPVLHICDIDASDQEQPITKYGAGNLFPQLRDRWPAIYLPGSVSVLDVAALPELGTQL